MLSNMRIYAEKGGKGDADSRTVYWLLTNWTAFSEMDSRGLTSLEEGGGVKKSQWSLWEQADKISGIGVIMMVSSINEDEDMKVCS